MRRFAALLSALAAASVLSACGSGHDRTPSLAGLPLAARSHVTVTHRICNGGTNAYCALEFVLIGDGYRSSLNLLGAERVLLRHHGWVSADAPDGLERAADSPDDKLRVTYATALGDLQGVDLGWIKRSRDVTLALSRTTFAHQTALSVVLELGTAT